MTERNETKNPIIDVRDLRFTYDGDSADSTVALCGVSLSVARGEYVAIVGHNGSGKSTLAKLLNGVLTATSGEIVIAGKTITAPDFSEEDLYALRRVVGMVFQNPDNQLVATTVEEDIAFGPENLCLPREEIKSRVASALARVGMTDYARHAPDKLSGGQKQRVAIAGMIAMKPDILIFDESTAMLDPVGRHDIVAIMEDLCRTEGITVLNITHYMEEAVRADRVVVMDDGKIVKEGTPRSVFSDTASLSALGLEPPQSAVLVSELVKAGLPLPKGLLGADETAEAILAVLKGGRV